MPPFIQNIDAYLSAALRSTHNPLLNFLATALTDITYAGFLWWVIAIILWRKGQKLIALEMFLALVFAIVEISVFKHMFHRERPTAITLHYFLKPLQQLTADKFSFPSGHALLAFAAAGVLRNSFPDWRGNLAIVVALAIGVARVYEGMHWPSDILAGLILGLITAGLSVPVASKFYARGENTSRALADLADTIETND